MIAHLRGRVLEVAGPLLTLDVQGVGYEITCASSVVHKLEEGQELSLIVWTDVREDSIRLYGFGDKLEKQVFLLLTRVKGIGSKSALEVVSRVDKKELLRIIAAGDTARLQSIKGIGKKSAERIVVELKEKVAEYALEGQAGRMGVELLPNGPVSDAVEALEALGFSRAEAEKAVKAVQDNAPQADSDASHLVKEALRFI